jgi:hypothetical protein
MSTYEWLGHALGCPLITFRPRTGRAVGHSRTSPTPKEFLLFQGRPYKLVARQGALRALTMPLRDSVPEGER